MATVTKPIILDETGQAMVTALQTIATHAAGLVGQGVPASGTTGQVLAKKSNTDYDTEWITPSGSTTEVFWATYGTTSYSDVNAAYTAGKLVCCAYSDRVYTLTNKTVSGNVTSYNFVAATRTTLYVVTVTSSNIWAYTDTVIPTSASDVGAIAAPSSPATGAFLVWDGSAWVAQTLSTWQGGSY